MIASITIPALIALLFKAVLLGYAAKSPTRNVTTRLFLVLLVVLALHNLVEFVGLNYFVRNGLTETMQRFGFAYIAFLIPAIALLLHVSLRISLDLPAFSRYSIWEALLYLPVAVLLFLLLFTDRLVVGFQMFQNTVLRVPGPLYFLFETYVAVYLLAALTNLFYGARSGRASAFKRARNRLWLVGLLPTGLLLVYLIVANHFGWTKITSTIYIPITLTFFLIVTTYATHQYRLFEIEFFIPWSKIRRRKTAFYRRIQAVVAEIGEMRSVKEILDSLAKTLQCQVALIGGPRPVVALAHEQQRRITGDSMLSQFPADALKHVDQIVIAHEIADREPSLHALMKQYKVGAIVPFNSHSALSAHWMLLGEHFSDNVYTPLDFKVVEGLFSRIAERFLDNLTLLRSQLADAHAELHSLQRRLAIAWDELTSSRRRVERLEGENRKLRSENARLRRQSLKVVGNELPEDIASGRKTLDQYLADYEAEIVLATLRRCRGNKAKAARLLGMWPNRIDYVLERHGLNSGDYD